MLMQGKQYDMPKHLVFALICCHEKTCLQSTLLRQESTLTLFTQNKQNCYFVKIL